MNIHFRGHNIKLHRSEICKKSTSTQPPPPTSPQQQAYIYYWRSKISLSFPLVGKQLVMKTSQPNIGWLINLVRCHCCKVICKSTAIFEHVTCTGTDLTVSVFRSFKMWCCLCLFFSLFLASGEKWSVLLWQTMIINSQQTKGNIFLNILQHIGQILLLQTLTKKQHLWKQIISEFAAGKIAKIHSNENKLMW